MKWVWDTTKDARNRVKHGLPLSIGIYALEDPLSLSQPDPHEDNDRWQTIGQVNGVLLFVVHTEASETLSGRIISVRKASKMERKAYENG